MHRRRRLARAVSLLALATLLGVSIAVTLPPQQAAATLPATEPDNTGMVNGKVRAIVQAGGRTWVAGEFTQMQDANGNNVRAVNSLAAFNASTGAPDLAVSIPSVTKTSGTAIVYDMSVGPDGKVYLAGAFDKVNGSNRKNVAAFDPFTGALSTFSATPANATSVLATSDAVYVGTSKLVKYTLSGADAPGYDPPEVATNPNIRGHTISAQFRDIVQVGTTLVAACQCDTLDDGSGFKNVKSVVKIDSGTGNRIIWAPAGLDAQSASFGISAIVRDVPSANDRTVFLAAGGSDFTAAYDYESGQQRWKTDTSGSSQVVAWHQNTVIVGGHFQWVPKNRGQQCADNARPNTACWHAPRLVAMDPGDGDVILQGGTPWNPGICCKYNGVWALLVDQDGGKLHVGGEFTKVGGSWSGSGTNWNLNGAPTQNYYGRLFAPATGTQTLSVSKTGTGTVTSSPAGINCGSTCSATYGTNTAVTLTATPGAGQTFTGWGGDCSGTSTTCVVTMNTSRAVVANFAPVSYALTVTKSGTGNGTVTSDVGGISCGATCSATYPGGTVVTLTAAQNGTSVFTGWSGGGCTGTGSCQVTMNAATTVTASFAPARLLTVTKTGTGSGIVTSGPVTTINCGATCSSQMAEGSSVTLSAVAAPGSVFTGWTGACSGTGSCVVLMDGGKTVTANFELLRTLTVSRAGAGSGTVTSDVGGINCGTGCSTQVANGTLITLSAAPGPDSSFTGWTGAGCSGTGTCQVTMDAAKSVTATFGLVEHPVTVSTNGTGGGSVSSSPSGISCPSTCSGPFVQGTNVSLTATPDANSTFTGWTGTDCSGSLPTCPFTVSGPRSATATFTAITHTLTVDVTPGQGSGSVTSDVGSIDCPATDCDDVYAQPTVVTLTAVADPGADFAGWSGGGCSGTGTCQVTMDQARSVSATFTLPYDLTVQVTGSGSVSADVGSIDCPATDCDDTYPSDSTVTLTATPDPNQTFTGWSGDCTGTDPECVVTMAQARSVAATFGQITHTLTVDVTPGQGSGSVTSDVGSIDCPATDCDDVYAQPTVVTLTAVADPGADFAGWSGGGCSGTGTCQVTMDQARSVSATFTLPYDLTVQVTGSGSVSADVGSIDCPATDCDDTYPSDSTVTLTATPDPNQTFTGWSGDCTGTNPECVVTMAQARSVAATFGQITHTLTVDVTPGQGSGSVTSDVGSIDCPATDCDDVYAQPTVVTLTAVADPGADFAGWSGGGCSGTGTCQVTMDQARSVSATFTLPYDLTVQVTGSGSVSADVGSIDCPATDCDDTYPSDSTVTLTATPDPNQTFTGWSGDCTGTDPECEVTMDQARSVAATFGQISSCGRILFRSTRSGNPDVWVMDADGANETNLTNRSGSDTDPVWSPDCSKIAFTSTRSGNVDIYVMNANGTGTTRLTTHSSPDTEPTWSPDGSKIAFVSTRTGNAEIFVMNANGSNQVNETNHSATDTSPDWSPDGTTIAFDSTRGGGLNIWTMTSTGGSPTKRTTGLGKAQAPAWSPNGAKIAFVSDSTGRNQIWTMDANGASPARLTNDAGTHTHPSWSPDGSKIAYANTASGRNQIWVINQNGSGAVNTSTSSRPDTLPSWSA